MMGLMARRHTFICGRDQVGLAILLAAICSPDHHASAAPGINTPSGQTELQIAVQGVTGLDLQDNATTNGVDTTVTGNLTANENAIVAGNTTTKTVTISDQAETVGASCPTLGTLAETSAGILLSCNTLGNSGLVWQLAQGGSGWVSMPPGTTWISTTYGWAPSGNMSPGAWCQQNGYTAATGACRGATGGSSQEYGSIISNTITESYWVWDCLWGGAATQGYIDQNTQILCVR